MQEVNAKDYSSARKLSGLTKKNKNKELVGLKVSTLS